MTGSYHCADSQGHSQRADPTDVPGAMHGGDGCGRGQKRAIAALVEVPIIDRGFAGVLLLSVTGRRAHSITTPLYMGQRPTPTTRRPAGAITLAVARVPDRA